MNQTWENCEKHNFELNFGPLQYTGKSMNQTFENDKKYNFGFDFSCLTEIWAASFLCMYVYIYIYIYIYI